MPSLSEKLAAEILVSHSPEIKSDRERGTRVLRVDGVNTSAFCSQAIARGKLSLCGTSTSGAADRTRRGRSGSQSSSSSGLMLIGIHFSGFHSFWSDSEPLRVDCRTGTL